MEKKMTELTNADLVNKLIVYVSSIGGKTSVSDKIDELREELLRRLPPECPTCHKTIWHSGLQREMPVPYYCECPTPAQPVENSSRCAKCKICREVEANYRHNTDLSPFAHKFEAEPISGGASTGEQPTGKKILTADQVLDASDEYCRTKGNPALAPVMRESFRKHREMPRAVLTSLNLKPVVMYETCAPKVEPAHPERKYFAGTGYLIAPTQATETASAPQDDSPYLKCEIGWGGKRCDLCSVGSPSVGLEGVAGRFHLKTTAAPSVAGTQPGTVEVYNNLATGVYLAAAPHQASQPMEEWWRQQYLALLEYTKSLHPGAAQGTPQVEEEQMREFLDEAMDYCKDDCSYLTSADRQRVAKGIVEQMAAKHGVGAPAQPGPEEKR
jgi:hypothetical protein